MRIHLGHHFYGAGNLGDDFMIAGFLTAMRTLAPRATFSCCVPFALEPLRQRFPAITWLPYDDTARTQSIAACDVWLGLGGSPFQSAQSRWFIDHLMREAEWCAGGSAAARKPMFFLGIGVQSIAELAASEVRRLCAQSAGIWTRDIASADSLVKALSATPDAPQERMSRPKIAAATDLAHLFFRETPPPPAVAGRLTLVANFDYAAWPGQTSFLRAIDNLPSVPPFSSSAFSPINDCVWLAQESRELPGAERALHAALPPSERALWRLVIPDHQAEPTNLIAPIVPKPLVATQLVLAPLPVTSAAPNRLAPTPLATAPLSAASPITASPLAAALALARWPSGEWLVTSRYHAALAGAWAGSKIIVIATNEKLRAVARELGCPSIAPDADEAAVARAFLAAAATPSLDTPPSAALAPPALSLAASADRAFAACAEFVRAAS